MDNQEISKLEEQVLAKLNAINKLKAFKTELAALRKQDYVPPNTEDLVLADGTIIFSPEYDFADAYTNPERAIYIFIECIQLESEVQGLPRRKVINTQTSMKIRESHATKDVPDRSIVLEQDVIVSPKPKQIIVIGSDLV